MAPSNHCGFFVTLKAVISPPIFARIKYIINMYWLLSFDHCHFLVFTKRFFWISLEGSGAMFFCQVFYLLWFFYLFFLKSPIGFFRKSLRTFWKNHMNFLKKPYEFLHKNLIDFLIVMVFLEVFSLLWFFTHLIRVIKP